jgi:ketosteroid isomerase-like protein
MGRFGAHPNVEHVRAAYAAYERAGVEALYPYLSPNVEWDMTKTALDSRVHRGHRGVRQFFGGLAKTWESFRFRYDEYIDAGDEILAIGRFFGCGLASGIEIEAPIVHIWTIRDGIGVRLEAYLDREQAFAAVGLTDGQPGE